MEISKNGFSFFIEKLETETDKQLIERSWFIVNQLDDLDSTNLKKKFENAVKESRLWSNIRNLNCKYIESIMNRISDKCLDNYC
jgi:hypothetical protein